MAYRETFVFKAGETYPLDHVYKVLALLPTGSFEQDDPADSSGDSGESLRFKREVRITITVSVKEGSK